jgi:Protein of unknown function (DUF1569)
MQDLLHDPLSPTMQHPADPRRRAFVRAGAGLTTGALLGSSPQRAAAAGVDRRLQFESLSAAEEELARLVRARERISAEPWSWGQTLVHLAQSIDYSMTGYPESRSWLFLHTAGPVALAFFSWRGRMSHDLGAPIPGAPAIDPGVPVAEAQQRLLRAITRFRAWGGPLQPHFAYGVLDKAGYERAHAMHLANHFSAFEGRGPA